MSIVKLLYDLRFYLEEKFPKIYHMMRKVASVGIKIKSRERKKKFGNLNENKIIYVIRIRREKLGLMAQYLAVLGHLDYALKKGYEAVVDFQNYPNTYLEPYLLHKENSWEYYFQQPSSISIEDAYRSKNVVLSNMETPKASAPRRMYYDNLCGDEKKHWLDLCEKSIRLQDNIRIACERKLCEILPNSVKEQGVVGVVCRGTDLLNFSNHSRQPSFENQIAVIKKLMQEWNCKYIYAASDSDMAIQRLKREFGEECVLHTDQKRFDCFESSQVKVLSDIHFDRDNDSYLKGKEYLESVYILSRCDVIFGSLIGATLGAICLAGNAGFKHIEIYDDGTY